MQVDGDSIINNRYYFYVYVISSNKQVTKMSCSSASNLITHTKDIYKVLCWAGIAANTEWEFISLKQI